MAQRSVSSFKSSKNGRYPDNSSGSISAANSRDMFEDVADSFINVTDLNGLTPASTTGTAIKFDAIRTYGYTTAETGNITLDTTNLKEGITQLVIHNNSVEPTFGVEFQIISGAYVTGVANYIFCHSVKSTLILVTISQEL